MMGVKASVGELVFGPIVVLWVKLQFVVVVCDGAQAQIDESVIELAHDQQMSKRTEWDKVLGKHICFFFLLYLYYEHGRVWPYVSIVIKLLHEVHVASFILSIL